MKNIIKISIMVLISFGLIGCAATTMGDRKVSTKKARVIFDVPINIDIDKITKGLFKAVSLRVDDLKEKENLMPEELSEKPGVPKQTNMFKGIAALGGGNPKLDRMQLDVSNAYYMVIGDGRMATGYNSKAEYYKAAIYPYKNGYKVYIYLFYQEGSYGITGQLTKMAVDALAGNEGALLFMAQIRDEFLKNVPESKIINQSPRKLEKIKLNSLGLTK